jgi:hypothetical protein
MSSNNQNGLKVSLAGRQLTGFSGAALVPNGSNGAHRPRGSPPLKEEAPGPAKGSSANLCKKDTSYQQLNGAQAQSSGSHLLLDEKLLVLQPSVAKAVGSDQAIVLQQLHFHLVNPKCGRVIGGKRWIYNSYEKWQEHDLPFWPSIKIKRIFLRLERQGLVISCQPETRADGSSNRRKYYRIDYEQFNKLVAAFPSQRIKMIPSDGVKMIPSIPETSTETTKRPKGNAPLAASFVSLSFPQSAEEITKTLQAKGLKIPLVFVQRFFADMQSSKWTIRRDPVRNWLATLQARWKKNKAHWSTDEPWRAGKMPLRRMRIEGLERLRERIVDESNKLFRTDPVDSKERRRELASHIKDVEAAWERKTKRSAEELGLKRAARQSVREHEAVKDKPIFPFDGMVTSTSTDQRRSEPTRVDQGYVLNGKFLTTAQANRLSMDNPALTEKMRRAVKRNGQITIQPNK